MDQEATMLWKACREGGDDSARGRIVEQHLPLVHHVARTIMRRLRGDVSLDELVNAGVVGLLHAVDSYEPERGHAFSTHAVPRIRGAILDDLRKSDVVARTVRRRARMIAIAERELAAQHDGRPDARQTAEKMQIDVETLMRWKAAAQQASHVSLDAPTQSEEGEGPTIGELIAGGGGSEIEDRLSLDEEKLAMRREFLRLAERERIVLMLYYFDELKLREIAEVLGLTESRISQIRTRALQTLRARLRPLREEA
jgi:RNA polymerase sigma factor for flagellar operon FliA